MRLTVVIAVIVVGTIVLGILSGFVIHFVVMHRNKSRQHALEKQELLMAFNSEMLKTQLEIHEHTLKNISQEIHDNVGQILSLAKLNLNMMDTQQPEQLQKKITSTLGQVTKAINDLRDLSKSFNTDNIIAQGLIQSIAAEMDIINKAELHKTAFRITGNSVLLEPQKELILFRIIQEALHNTIKHAEAKYLAVHADFKPAALELSIYDDGKGFDPEPLNQANGNGAGLGIRNMHNRAKMIGADFSMSSTVGNGTMVKIVLPLAAETHLQ